MPSQPVIIGAQVGGQQVAPSEATFTYRILVASTLADRGGLRGVLNEPTFKNAINTGSAALSLTLDHYPKEITYGDIIRVTYPSGQVAGMWRHEAIVTKIADRNSYQITLAPLIAEAGDADYTANWSNDTTQPTAALGPAGFDVPVRNALARTMHLKAPSLTGSNTTGSLNSNGTAYSYAYNNATVLDTLNQAIVFGGAGWWWSCDHNGVVTLSNASPFTHVVTMGREAISGEWKEDIHSLCNGQPVTGGQPGGSTTALTAFASDVNPSNPYSVPNLGRRTAKPYPDSSLMDQAGVNAVATSLLGYAERVSKHRTIRLTNYTIRRPVPGEALKIRVSDPDPSLLTNPVSVLGPFLITEVVEHGGTYVFDVTISADMVVPVTAIQPLLAQQTAIDKLMQNPVRSAVSPDGTQGYVGAGPINGPTGGAQFNQFPSAPVGLAGTTGIDNIAQTNNAFVNLTWSPNSANDVVTGYDVRWRKGGDTQYYYGHSGTTALKAGGLIPGFTYGFSVQAQNDLGNRSPWSVELTLTTAQKTTPPAQPKGLVGIRTPRGADVQWNGNTEPDLQGYLLQVSVGNGPFTVINPSPDLKTSAHYTASSGTPQQTILVFRVAAVDWSGNQSSWSTASANIPTDGTAFDEIMTGNLTATGTITGGLIRTGSSGPRVEFDNAGIRLYDGSGQDYGAGAGVSSRLRSQDGSAFFKGTVTASRIQGLSGANPSMSIDMTGAPLLDVKDAAGVDRVQIGSIAGGYGAVVNDATGAAIWDTIGLQQVMARLGTVFGTSVVTVSGNTDWVAVPDATYRVSFPLARPVTILVLAGVVASVNPQSGTGASNFASVGLQMDATTGRDSLSNYTQITAAPGASFEGMFSAPLFLMRQLPAGSHTVYMVTRVDSSTNISFQGGSFISVFQLGA